MRSGSSHSGQARRRTGLGAILKDRGRCPSIPVAIPTGWDDYLGFRGGSGRDDNMCGRQQRRWGRRAGAGLSVAHQAVPHVSCLTSCFSPDGGRFLRASPGTDAPVTRLRWPPGLCRKPRRAQGESVVRPFPIARRASVLGPTKRRLWKQFHDPPRSFQSDPTRFDDTEDRATRFRRDGRR